MPPIRSTPGSAGDWLARAKSDLAIARVPLPAEAFYEDLCFHAQQVAEKALKAVYQHRSIVFRYTHDLDALIDGLETAGVSVPESVRESDALSRYAWEARYPGLQEPVTEEEYREAVKLAEAVVEWATQEIE